MIVIVHTETGEHQFLESLGEEVPIAFDAETGEPTEFVLLGAPGPEWTVLPALAPEGFTATECIIVDGVCVPNLTLFREQQRAIINAAHDAARDGGATTTHGVFDSNGESRELLQGTIKYAEITEARGGTFEGYWTNQADQDEPVDLEKLQTIGLEIAQHVAAVHLRARVLKARIDAAETVAAIRAVVWTLEDPEGE